ncbi:hypothetical protein SMC26_44475, partial [Actinomadura fulvescens]
KTEYSTAVDHYRACVTSAGYQVTPAVLSPVDGLTMQFEAKLSGDPTVYNQAVDDCNHRHLSHIEPAYFERHTQVMNTRLRSATAACLAGKHAVVTGKEKKHTGTHRHRR